ncbi:MAG: TlpA disulfide reductase family protein [Bacteroidota bacterium]
MATVKERFEKWKDTRNRWQKAGDVAFWILLLLLIIPGPRKTIATTVNRVMLNIKAPGMMSEEKQVQLSEGDYQWTLVTEEGTPLPLQSAKGKPIFLNFWATWCPPCVAELPEIQRAYEKHGQSVEFLLVTSQEPAEVNAFMEKHGYDLPVVYAQSAAPRAFTHRAIPTTYIISPEGRIVVKKSGAVNWDSKGTDKIFKQLLR